jgi:hypothetical protein
VIDSKDEQSRNAADFIRTNSESVPNEIDESDSQNEKHNEQII